ncbi:MauE/DoxX family redox-associated membrane protein [Actinomadura yumaensis]|uniref:MauE/DoxX family redox-associated membrane protein n=1 Tax=Actinomadura yumaensis TaxID=111807 RepID=A0ABW2CTI3_9ACTN
MTISDLQNAQVLLLAAVLLAACLAKLTIRAPVADVPDHVHGVPVPARLRRATALRSSRGLNVGLGVGEGALGLALLLSPHLSVRIATTVAFAAATWAVGELRVHRPDAGCGCFGGLSAKRVGRRSVARAALFTGAGVVSLTAPHAGLAVLRHDAAQVWPVLVLELAVFAAISPELSAPLDRRGLRTRPPVPCGRRLSPLAETYATLHDSPAWLAYENVLASAVPLDVWREGCWRFVVYPARVDGRPMEAVFAVSTAARDREVKAVLLAPERPEPPDLPADGRTQEEHTDGRASADAADVDAAEAEVEDTGESRTIGSGVV